MTDREEFRKWYKENSTKIIKDYGFGTFSEDVMFEAWQARGELDAARIKELEDRLNSIAIDWQVKERECITLRNDKATLEIQVQTLREALSNIALGKVFDQDIKDFCQTALEELDK